MYLVKGKYYDEPPEHGWVGPSEMKLWKSYGFYRDSKLVGRISAHRYPRGVKSIKIWNPDGTEFFDNFIDDLPACKRFVEKEVKRRYEARNA